MRAPVLDDAVRHIERGQHETPKALARVGMFRGPSHELRTQCCLVRLEDRFCQRVLGLKVVVDVAQRDICCFCNISQRRALQSLLMKESSCRSDELGAFLHGGVRDGHL